MAYTRRRAAAREWRVNRWRCATPPDLRHRRPDPDADDDAARGSAPSPASTNARRVLIVDDEMSIRLICRINLHASGWRCAEAANGEEALARIKDERPDVVLLDVMMPLLDGWTVAERLRSDPQTRDIPIVFLTARAERPARRRAYDLGAIAYLTKPLDPVALPNELARLLDRIDGGEADQVRREVLEGDPPLGL